MTAVPTNEDAEEDARTEEFPSIGGEAAVEETEGSPGPREIRADDEPRRGGEEEDAGVDDDDDDDDNDDGGVDDNSARHGPPAPSAAGNDSVPDDRAGRDLDLDLDLLGHLDPSDSRYREIIASAAPTTPLEVALRRELDRHIAHGESLANEISKLQRFLSKRKQTYKRKKTDVDAPRKRLTGYNVFVRERFAALAKENEEALRSGGSGIGSELKRIPPSSNISSTGRAWSMLSAEEKERYNAMAKPDEDRYKNEKATYQAPAKDRRKRNRTGYNLFFSRHVYRLKTYEGGIPPERGSTARVVGDAWKRMSPEEREAYEREADGMYDYSDDVAGGGEGYAHCLHRPPQHRLLDADGGGGDASSLARGISRNASLAEGGDKPATDDDDDEDDDDDDNDDDSAHRPQEEEINPNGMPPPPLMPYPYGVPPPPPGTVLPPGPPLPIIHQPSDVPYDPYAYGAVPMPPPNPYDPYGYAVYDPYAYGAVPMPPPNPYDPYGYPGQP